MQPINEMLRAAENKLSRAAELIANVKRAHGDVNLQERQASDRELPCMCDYTDVNDDNRWTEQQLFMRQAAGLQKDVPPVVGALHEQQVRQRKLAGLLVQPAGAVITRTCAFLPAFAQEAHARMEKLDQAFRIASETVDRKASLDVPGYPTVMTAAELWAALEEETSALRRAAQP